MILVIVVIVVIVVTVGIVVGVAGQLILNGGEWSWRRCARAPVGKDKR